MTRLWGKYRWSSRCRRPLLDRHHRYVVLYIAAMWVSGIMQGLMWRAIPAAAH
jgi:cbb3-type cytochrome oxidase subunit 1